MWIAVLTEFADDLGIIKLIILEEFLRVLICVDLDLCEGVVDSRNLNAFSDSLV
jgi:hypothetical protein